jgi:hypothetical protein
VALRAKKIQQNKILTPIWRVEFRRAGLRIWLRKPLTHGRRAVFISSGEATRRIFLTGRPAFKKKQTARLGLTFLS